MKRKKFFILSIILYVFVFLTFSVYMELVHAQRGVPPCFWCFNRPPPSDVIILPPCTKCEAIAIEDPPCSLCGPMAPPSPPPPPPCSWCPPPPGSCGTLNGRVFSYHVVSWPSGSFCSSGSVVPSSPSFPAQGQTTTWRCTTSGGSRNCSARREGKWEQLTPAQQAEWNSLTQAQKNELLSYPDEAWNNYWSLTPGQRLEYWSLESEQREELILLPEDIWEEYWDLTEEQRLEYWSLEEEQREELILLPEDIWEEYWDLTEEQKSEYWSLPPEEREELYNLPVESWLEYWNLTDEQKSHYWSLNPLQRKEFWTLSPEERTSYWSLDDILEWEEWWRTYACGSLDGNIFAHDALDFPSGESFCRVGNPNPVNLDYPDSGQKILWSCSDFGLIFGCSASREYPPPWISTRGGLVHSGGSIRLAVQDVLYSNVFTTDLTEYVSLSTELVTVGTETLNLSLSSKYYLYNLVKYSSNVRQSWYEVFLRRAQLRDVNGVFWTELFTQTEGVPLDLGLTGELNSCKNNAHIYFVNGDLKIQPDDYEDLASDELNGCIFVVSGDIIIVDGEYKSEGFAHPRYDIIRGYFIADGIIKIHDVDSDKDIKDGLKVVGGLYASGPSPSIQLRRKFRLQDNLNYPALVVFHDNRYYDISSRLLGDVFGGGYIRDVGLKE